MKSVALIAVIFCVFVTVTKGWSLPLGAVDHQTFSPKNLVTVSRVARGVNEAECNRVLGRAQCSPSFVQDYINAVSQCGSDGSVLAITLEKHCRQNSAGEYCLSVGYNIADIITNCGSSSCSAACRNSLSDLGCCLNSFIDQFAQNFTACGLAFPSACPPSSFNIPTSSNNPSCSSSDDFVSFGLDYICSNGRPIFDALISNNCLEHARLFQASCRYRSGKNCQEVIRTTSTMQINAITSCPSTSSCSSSCKSSLNDLKNGLGCCLNQFNASLEDVIIEDATYSTVTANALWQECGITPPGVCASSINAAAPAAYTTAGNIAFLVLAASIFNFVSY